MDCRMCLFVLLTRASRTESRTTARASSWTINFCTTASTPGDWEASQGPASESDPTTGEESSSQAERRSQSETSESASASDSVFSLQTAQL